MATITTTVTTGTGTGIDLDAIWATLQGEPAIEALEELIPVMERHLAVRDAVLLAIIDDAMPRGLFDAAVERPGGATLGFVGRRMDDLRMGRRRLDVTRAQSYAAAFGLAYGHRQSATAAAMAGYLHWIAGDVAGASRWSRTALGIDPRCTLPALVIAAADHGIRWLC